MVSATASVGMLSHEMYIDKIDYVNEKLLKNIVKLDNDNIHLHVISVYGLDVIKPRVKALYEDLSIRYLSTNTRLQ